MKKKSLLPITLLATAGAMILSSCSNPLDVVKSWFGSKEKQEDSTSTDGGNSTNTDSTGDSNTDVIITGGTITRPDEGEGGTPAKSTSMEKALNYDYSNVTLGIDTLFNRGQNETYYQELYIDDHILTYTPEVAANYGLEYAFEEFYVQDGQSYKWFDAQKDIPNSKGGWMQKGYRNADLSIWVGNFYLPYALTMLEPSDFKMNILGNYYIEDPVKRADFIDEVFGWVIYDTEGSAYPVDVTFVLDSETSAIHKIFAFFDEATSGKDDCVEVEFAYFGETSTNGAYTLHDAPNESNKTTYWQYYGWPHDYAPAYFKSLELEVGSAPSEHVNVNGSQVTMDIDKLVGINLFTNPSTFQPWDLVDYEHANIVYEYDESILEMKSSFNYSKEFHSLKAGTATIKATVLGEDNQLIESNEIAVTVNEAPTQDLTNAVYKFSWVGYTDETNPTKVFANNDYANGLPFEIESTDTNGTKFLDSKYSSVFEAGETLLLVSPGHATTKEGKPSATTGLTFDFDDQQVSELSFNYASFYAGQITQFLGNLKSFVVSTSNDGENWTDYDATDILKEEVSDDFIKLFDVTFAPASKVKISFNAYICGKDGTLGIDSVAFSTNSECHNHNTSTTVPVTGVTLSRSTMDVEVGSTETLVATVAPVTATNQEVTWSSSDTTVATVENGVVTALKEGTTQITVRTTDGGYTATCLVTVTPKPTIPAEYAGKYYSEDRDATVVIDAENGTITFQDSSYTATLDFKGIENKTMTFARGNDKLVVIKDSEGVYFGTSSTSKLNGTYLQGNWVFVKQVEATDFTLKVTGATANSDGTYPIIKGQSLVVTAVNFKPTDANVKNITWRVEAGTGNGTYDVEYSRFTATKAGTATLKATLNGEVVKTVTFVISEPVNVTSITVTAEGGATSLICDKTLQLTANVNPANADNKSVTWSSSNTKVATVTVNGLVMPKAVTENTTVTITATSVSDPTVSGSITLTITPRPSEGVVPAGMVGNWLLLDGDGWFDAYLTINADGTGVIGCSDAEFEESFIFDSVSGNDYLFYVSILGDPYELVVTFDGSEISQVTFDDAVGYMYSGSLITFSTVVAA